MLRLKVTIILSVLIIFLTPFLVLASEVILKSGEKIEGKIVEHTDKYIKIDAGMGTPVTYYSDEINTIDGQNVVPPQNNAPLNVRIIKGFVNTAEISGNHLCVSSGTLNCDPVNPDGSFKTVISVLDKMRKVIYVMDNEKHLRASALFLSPSQQVIFDAESSVLSDLYPVTIKYMGRDQEGYVTKLKALPSFLKVVALFRTNLKTKPLELIPLDPVITSALYECIGDFWEGAPTSPRREAILEGVTMYKEMNNDPTKLKSSEFIKKYLAVGKLLQSQE